MQLFSERHGLNPQKEILYRNDIPDELRSPVIAILAEFIPTAFIFERLDRIFNPFGLDPLRNPSTADADTEANQNTAVIQQVLSACPWFRVLDAIEDLYGQLLFHDTELRELDEEARAHLLERKLNSYFVYAGIGWQLKNGEIITRGAEAFEEAVKTARVELNNAGRTTASKHIHAALQALSNRPEADTSGAVYHAMGALECVARDLSGEPKLTLGQILKRRPDLLPKPLDEALSQIWGYASNEARHVAEGRAPNMDGAELIVGLAANIATYLNKKQRLDGQAR